VSHPAGVRAQRPVTAPTLTTAPRRTLGVGVVGCGFVADYYMATLGLHQQLEIVGAYDQSEERRHRFSTFHSVPAYSTLEELLADDRVGLVVNLTNPRSHAEVSRAALQAGKHVYSEKPLAMDLVEAKELVERAERGGLLVSSAPCSLLGETAQTVWRALRDGVVGPVRVVYAEMDEGMVFRMPYRRWASASGAPWPYRDEFEVGTVIEHAGYVVSWLPAMFGSALSVSGYSTCVVPDKGRDPPIPVTSADFAVACITFESGILVRLTCSLLAPHDHSLRVVGDGGVLCVEDTWYYSAAVKIRRWHDIRGRHVERPWRQRYPLVALGRRYGYRGTQQMDFARGVADLADAVLDGRPPRLSARYSLHVNEIVLAVSSALDGGGTYRMTTTAGTVEPMPWATASRPGAAARAVARIRRTRS
jgi:predicted dehydrogenase